MAGFAGEYKKNRPLAGSEVPANMHMHIFGNTGLIFLRFVTSQVLSASGVLFCAPGGERDGRPWEP